MKAWSPPEVDAEPSAQVRARRPIVDDGLLTAMVWLALAVGLAHRLLIGWRAPLWLDETFTGAIAVQPSFAALVRWCLHELSGPVYYGTIWCWQKLAGDSDTALRLPSLACSIAAPLLILWRGHPDRDLRRTWAALTAVWLPGLMMACEARPYALVVLLTTAQAIAFLAMMRAPATWTAVAWAAVSALAILTHYHALFVTGLQGLLYLGAGGRAAWRSWPAALPFVPAAAWISFHLPFLLSYASPQVVWYNKADASLIPVVPFILFGVGMPATMTMLAIAATWAWQMARAATGKPGFGYERSEVLLVASGVGACLIVLGLAFVRPSFAPRYLTPSMPAILFGVALWARRCGSQWRVATAALLAGTIALALGAIIVRRANPQETDHRYYYNFEQPSAWLEARGVRRMIFLWDNPTNAIGDPFYMRQIADFFFRRDGRPIPIILPALPRDADPNLALPAIAPEAGTGLLWAYDTDTRNTFGGRHPARIAAIDPRWTCRNFGKGPITVEACIRR